MEIVQSIVDKLHGCLSQADIIRAMMADALQDSIKKIDLKKIISLKTVYSHEFEIY